MTSDDIGLPQSPAQGEEGGLTNDGVVQVTCGQCQGIGCGYCDEFGYFNRPARPADPQARKSVRFWVDASSLSVVQDALDRANECVWQWADTIGQPINGVIEVVVIDNDPRVALSAEGSGTIAAARLAAEEMRERAAEEAYWHAAEGGTSAQIADAIRSLPLPPSSSPEDQEKAAATPTIADPVKEGGNAP